MDGEGLQLGMTGVALDGRDVATGAPKGLRNRRVPESVWTGDDSGEKPQPANYVEDRGAGETIALAGAIEVGEEWTGIGSAEF